ncbi:alpha-1-inhibitor 3-like isoform X2 [Penaeus chinensis]|uniref:alpha-1-inhibitor 3-like isoform X2 n=1 Tax=Penaeus chinensis TaxID=139456 RepID=UPI001FB8357D|nr:alpha-1-inhibitor 3-like isoform X2 [Penaeus chinensis]
MCRGAVAMAGRRALPFAVLVSALFAAVCGASFLLVTPLQWTAGEGNLICLHLQRSDRSANDTSEIDFVHVSVRDPSACEAEQDCQPILTKTFIVQPGEAMACQEVIVPHLCGTRLDLLFDGEIGGVDLGAAIGGKEGKRVLWGVELLTMNNVTLLETDKVMYKPGQEVKVRVLSLHGAEPLLVTEEYPEIWVTAPSKTRVAQWNNVNNSAGLVHLSFQLADEPEQGMYRISVKNSQNGVTWTTFEVIEYVLPRFEVKVTAPGHITGKDEAFTIGVCAEYTFGQPVRGSATIEVSNGMSDRCQTQLVETEEIAGCKDFQFTTEEMRVIDCTVDIVYVKVVVEEEGTGVRQSEGANIEIMRQLYKFEIVHKDKYKKPNVPYKMKTRLVFFNGTAAEWVPVEVCAAGKCATVITEENGIIEIGVSAKDVESIKMSTLDARVDLYQASLHVSIVPFFSPSDSSLVIQAPGGRVKCVPGQKTIINLPVLFSANNQSRARIHAQVVSRGKIQHSWTEEVELKASELPIDPKDLIDASPPTNPSLPIVTGVFSLQVILPPTASPEVKILIWYTRDDGEVVSDSVPLDVEKCLGFSANLAWSEAQSQPGEEVELSLESEPYAVCSLGVVDRSTELAARDLFYLSTAETLLASLDRRFRWNGWSQFDPQVDDQKYCAGKDFEGSVGDGPSHSFGKHFYWSDYVDSLKMFDDSGLLVVSDMTLETRPCKRPDSKVEPVYLEEPDPLAGEAPAAARTRFPETWLWTLVAVPSNGAVDQKLTLPDTITEWAGQAVCAHADKGVGLSGRASITAFTPFFTDLTLPPSVKRGEILPVKISVFNYLHKNLPVSFLLEDSPDIDILVESDETGEKESEEDDFTLRGPKKLRTTCLKPQDKAVHTIKIRMLSLGDVNLTVSAYVDHSIRSCEAGSEKVKRRDTLIKSIKVEAEGYLREKTWSQYICANESTEGKDVHKTGKISAPSNIVKGSDRAWVTVEGDLLALSIQNLGSLIRMPYGCGEQNMVNFAPYVFMMQYLKATGQDAPANTEKILEFMKIGYQRQLLYRRSNGSYSAFGNADDSGSTWLTAFVLRSFAQAKEFISIDIQALNQTTEWLLRSETEHGCVVPKGKGIHKGLEGDASGPLTAYVLAALIEAGTPSRASFVKHAARCILSDKSKDPYTLALKSYALTLAGHPNGKKLLRQLIDLAVVKKNAMYWNRQAEPAWGNSLAIETAGYAVLAMLSHGPQLHMLRARKVVQWLTSRRNGWGGFYSTQDTVVALQAMARYEAHKEQKTLDVVVAISTRNFSVTLSVTEENRLLQQRHTIPQLPTKIRAGVGGRGCAIVQAVLRYNVPEAEPSDAFSLRVQAINDPRGGCVEKRLEACSAYLLPDGKSNMAVIEVNLVSGFIPGKDDLKEVVRRNPKVVKRYEVDGSKVTFYMDEFTTGEEVCVSFRVTREVEVEDAQPGTVVVYDYYQPEFSVSQNFVFVPMEGCS